MRWFKDWLGYETFGIFYGLHVRERRARQAEAQRQREAILKGRIAELEGRPAPHPPHRPNRGVPA